jgi:autotransporter-associated beta strand protein
LNNFNETIGSLAGASGASVALGSGTLSAGGNNTSTVYAGVISGSGGLNKTGAGALTLTGPNAYTGGTTISGGTLQLGNGGATGGIPGNVSDNRTLAFNRSDTVTFAGLISGSGNLNQIGSGTTILTANNTYPGGTIISAGTLQLGNGGTMGALVGNVTDNGSLVFDRSNSITFNGKISGSGNFIQSGSGTTIIGGTNTYSGGTIINNGTLLVNSAQALGLGDVTVNGGVLGADPQAINVKGNYTQNARGTLQLNVAGPNPASTTC